MQRRYVILILVLSAVAIYVAAFAWQVASLSRTFDAVSVGMPQVSVETQLSSDRMLEKAEGIDYLDGRGRPVHEAFYRGRWDVGLGFRVAFTQGRVEGKMWLD